jgi:hypothetical protein
MQVNIRSDGVEIDAKQHRQIERLVRLGLTRFEPTLRRVQVTVDHSLTPIHGSCWRAGIRVELNRLRDVAVDDVERQIEPAVERAVGRAARAVERRIASSAELRGVG